MAINKVILVGNVGKDPEVRHLDTGRCGCKFSTCNIGNLYCKKR